MAEEVTTKIKPIILVEDAKPIETDVLAWIETGPFTKAQVLIALKLDEAEREAPTARGKLQTEDYAVIVRRLIEGVPAKKLANDYKVSAARISEIRREKSIPITALRSYLEAKAKALEVAESA